MKKLLLSTALCLSALAASAFEYSDITSLYVIGEAVSSGWSQADAPEMTSNGNGVFTWTGNLKTGQVKFIIGRDTWDSLVSADCDNYGIVLDTPMNLAKGDEAGDNKWYNNEAGAYTLTVDLNAKTLTVSADASAFVPTAFAISGSALTCTPAEQGPSIFKYMGAISAGTFKVKATDAEGKTQWLKAGDNNAYTYVSAESAATAYTTEAIAKAQLFIDAASQTLSWNAYEAPAGVWIVGSDTDWSFVEMTQSTEDSDVYEWTGAIGTSKGTEIKFMTINNFDNDGVYGIHPYFNGENLLEANYFCQGGNDNKWAVPEDTNYKIKVNPYLQTVSASKESGIATAEVNDVTAPVEYYNLQGIRVNNPQDGQLVIRRQGTDVKKIIF